MHNLLKESSRHFYYWPINLPTQDDVMEGVDIAKIDKMAIRTILFDTRRLHISNILLLTEPKTTKKILRQAKQLGLVSNRNSWMILNLVSGRFFLSHC